MTKLGSTRFAVELVYVPYLALTAEASARIVVPLFTTIAANPLLAIADFDLRIRGLACGAYKVWLFNPLSFRTPAGFSGWRCCAKRDLEWDRLSAHSFRGHISSRQH